jgi:RNA polymerase sigma factor (sigma-70 family)
MAGAGANGVLEQLRTLMAAERADALTDRELLECFVRDRDEAAFTALLRRHGSMVLRVCRGVLGNEADAEDAFQATFMVLARKARRVQWRESIGSWLHEVARRVAHEAKTRKARRQMRESQAEPRPTGDPLADITGRDLLDALDQEIARLSQRYRAPLVLCCLEGQSGEEAARQLGCSLSTLKRRLSRARQVLHVRLKRRGLALPAAALATLLLHKAASAALPAGLVRGTIQAAILYAAGGNVGSTASASALALAEAMVYGMVLTKLKLTAAVLAVGCLLGGLSVWAHESLTNRQAIEQQDEEPPVLALSAPPAMELDATAVSAFVREQHFDHDPGWEGFNNRIVPVRIPTVTQGFGYSATNHAGKEKGEIGGRVTRSTTPAYYADRIGVKTLNDKLTASGSFALTSTSGNSAVFFGWFNAVQPGGGRPINSLGLYLDGEKERDGKGARLAVRLIAGTNRSCGTPITPYQSGKQRPTPVRTDGTRYTWTLDYDPEANAGNGQIQFRIQSNRGQPDDWEGQLVSLDLPAGFKKEGAVFDRFGLMNLMTPGNAMTIYFDDLQYDGKVEAFARDPGWEGTGNHATFADPEQKGAHDFGFSAGTNFAGGAPGEIGGTLWRGGSGYAYYADRVGPLTLEDRLEARGRVVLKVGAQQSDMYFGWFNSASKDRPPVDAGHFLGIHLGGPSRVGHYFRPAYTMASGTRGGSKTGPVLVPDQVYEWSIIYDPTANNGAGAIQVTLGDESVTLPLRKGRRVKEACFDRFGLFTSAAGGSLMKVYFDDLKYTAARPTR